MFGLPQDPTGVESVFWMCALGGTLFFLLRVLLVIFAGFGDHDISGAHAVGHDFSGDVHAHDAGTGSDLHDTDAAFKLLSLNSVSAFVMMFGWGGLAAFREHQLGGGLSLVVGLTTGLLMMLITSYLFVIAQKFTTRGADFSIEKTVGKTAKVYMRIPEGGKGRVHISIDGILRELDAEAEDGSAIESFADVQILSAAGPALVKVSPLTRI